MITREDIFFITKETKKLQIFFEKGDFEKVIKKDLHIDTDEEKALKLKTTIDTLQDTQIAKNREAIEKLK